MNLFSELDHLVYAAPDLEETVDSMDRLLGVRAVPGGRHPGLGTRNALIALGKTSYLEILAPDPEQPDPDHPRPFGIDDLLEPRLATWVIHTSRLEERAEAARRAGYDPGPVGSLGRTRPDGVRLSWKQAVPRSEAGGLMTGGDGLVPFLIDWRDSPHPAAGAPSGCSLVVFRAEHPDPESVARMLAAMKAPLTVTQGPEPALIAVLDSPRGRVELR
jgi:hypothetical protein